MPRNRLGSAARLAIVASIGLPLCGQTAVGNKDFLGCDWDIANLHERGDGGLSKVDSDMPTDGNFLVYFYDHRFDGLGSWVDFQAEVEEGRDIVVTRYVTNDEVPMPGITVYVIERKRYIGHVVMFNQHHTGLIEKCD